MTRTLTLLALCLLAIAAVCLFGRGKKVKAEPGWVYAGTNWEDWVLVRQSDTEFFDAFIASGQPETSVAWFRTGTNPQSEVTTYRRATADLIVATKDGQETQTWERVDGEWRPRQ